MGNWSDKIPTKPGWYWTRVKDPIEYDPIAAFWFKDASGSFVLTHPYNPQMHLALENELHKEVLDNLLWIGPLEVPPTKLPN